MTPSRRAADNGPLRYLRLWPVVLFLVAMAAGAGAVQYQVGLNTERIDRNTDAIIDMRQSIVRMDERSAWIKTMLERIDASMRELNHGQAKQFRSPAPGKE